MRSRVKGDPSFAIIEVERVKQPFTFVFIFDPQFFNKIIYIFIPKTSMVSVLRVIEIAWEKMANILKLSEKSESMIQC